MDYKEEQVQELEVLESIYPDELTILNNEYPEIKFNVLVRLELNDTAIYDNDLLQSLNKVHSLDITFQLPDNYPDMAPIIHIVPIEEIINEEESDDGSEEEDEYDEHGFKVLSKLENLPDMISLKDYMSKLNTVIQEQIENDMLIGMQMCFALISTIKESSENWFIEQLDALAKEHEIELEKREAEEQKKFTGTKVTKESYLEWRSGFRQEMNLEERDKDRRLHAHNGKLNGKQMFEQGVVGAEDDDIDVDGIAVDLEKSNI